MVKASSTRARRNAGLAKIEPKLENNNLEGKIGLILTVIDGQPVRLSYIDARKEETSILSYMHLAMLLPSHTRIPSRLEHGDKLKTTWVSIYLLSTASLTTDVWGLRGDYFETMKYSQRRLPMNSIH